MIQTKQTIPSLSTEYKFKPGDLVKHTYLFYGIGIIISNRQGPACDVFWTKKGFRCHIRGYLENIEEKENEI